MTPSTPNLTTDPIPKLLRYLAIPASLGFFFNTMYNVVDTWVAGQITSESLAALSLSFPVFFILIAIGSGMGNGMTALISTELGANDQKKASEYAAQSISFGLLLAIVLSVVGYYMSPFLFQLLGASGSYLETALSYMQPLFIGSIFLSMTFTLNAILNALGDTKSYRNVLIVSFFLNLILSPLLAFDWLGTPALGILGIALATIITNLVGAVYLGYKVYKTSLISSECMFCNLTLKWSVIKDILTQGLPASFTMMTMAIGAFIITFFVSKFGANAVAGYGTAMRIEQMVLIPSIGINIAILTLIGQNNGAKRYDRVKEVLNVGFRYMMYLGTIGAGFIYFFSGYLIKFFTSDAEVISFGIGYLLIAALMTWGYGIIFLTDSAFRGLKRPLFPLILGVFRQFILPIPLFWIATSVLLLGITSIWWSIFIIVWISALVSWWYLNQVVKTLEPVVTDNYKHGNTKM
jgi:putative MATE family efflux protein